MKNKAPRKKPAVNRVYYIYVGILAVLFFTFHTIPFLNNVIILTSYAYCPSIRSKIT